MHGSSLAISSRAFTGRMRIVSQNQARRLLRELLEEAEQAAVAASDGEAGADVLEGRRAVAAAHRLPGLLEARLHRLVRLDVLHERLRLRAPRLAAQYEARLGQRR